MDNIAIDDIDTGIDKRKFTLAFMEVEKSHSLPSAR